MHRLEDWINGAGAAHVHVPSYEIIGTETSRPRVFFGARGDAPELFQALTLGLTPPYLLLYILHTPRGEGEPGRYESESIDRERFTGFISSYREYLVADGRFDIWAHSYADNTTVAWDRHNYMYAYGSLDQHVKTLEAFGYRPGSVDRIAERPHVHHYRSEQDTAAITLLEEFDWKWGPLKPVDEQ